MRTVRTPNGRYVMCVKIREDEKSREADTIGIKIANHLMIEFNILT